MIPEDKTIGSSQSSTLLLGKEMVFFRDSSHCTSMMLVMLVSQMLRCCIVEVCFGKLDVFVFSAKLSQMLMSEFCGAVSDAVSSFMKSKGNFITEEAKKCF